jgi:oligogalacturonide transport system substrate-binding protein
MKITHKFIIGGIIVVMLLLSSQGASAETLRFSWWGEEARHKATLETIRLFMKTYPDMTIIPEYMGWDGYLSKLMLEVARDSLPNIIQSDFKFFPDLVKKENLFYDLYELTDSIDISGFDQKFLEQWCIYDGKLMALPTGLNAETAMINQTLMAKAGIDPHTVWTWELLAEEGRKLHQQFPDAYFLIQGAESLTYHVLFPYVKQLTGNELVNDDYTLGFDQRAMTQALGYLKTLFDDGVLLPLQQSAEFGIRIAENPKWVNGQGAMYLEFTTHFVVAKTAAKNQQITVARLPVMDNAKQTGIMIAPAQLISISRQTRNMKAAATFVNFFLNDKDAVLALGLVRSVPATRHARRFLTEAGHMDAELAKAIDIGLTNAGLPGSLLSSNLEIFQIFKYAVELVGYKRHTPIEAAEILMDQLEKKLAAIKKQNG